MNTRQCYLFAVSLPPHTVTEQVSLKKEILKIRAEINAKGTKETIAKINKAKSWFFEKINKIDKPDRKSTRLNSSH